MTDQTTGRMYARRRLDCRLSVATRRITFEYTNWRGETRTRTVEPADVWFGRNEWHLEPQWFMTAADIEKGAMRDFAMRDMKEVRYAE